ncbi:MAG: hypothetical protein ABJK59_09280 [Erythrobacter sp.]|uniref:hypothetical protein n=1 Tax=Erythrobacter sp. TaxID=1042 RepID=UPI00329A535E
MSLVALSHEDIGLSSIGIQYPTDVTLLHRFGLVSIGVCLAALGGPLSAQDEPNGTGPNEAAEVAAPAAPEPEERVVLDLIITKPRSQSDQLLIEDCEEEADAARIANEIVVCRQLGEETDGSWNKEEFERNYAQRTQGEKPVDVAGGGIFKGPATLGGLCVIPPCPGEAALIIDVEALPEAPKGSDADRIARGLPPLGQDEELSPEEIQRRRRAAGLDAPDVQ